MGDRSSSRLPASLAFLTRSSRAARALAIRCSRASSLSVSLSSEELPDHATPVNTDKHFGELN